MGCSSSKEDDVPGAAAAKKTEEGAAQNGKPASESDIVVSMDKGTMDRVKSIFSTWDIDSAGKLELAAFTGAIVQVGPHETKILDRLKDMDIDNDGFVTQEVAAARHGESYLCPPAADSRAHPAMRPWASAGVAQVVHGDLVCPHEH